MARRKYKTRAATKKPKTRVRKTRTRKTRTRKTTLKQRRQSVLKLYKRLLKKISNRKPVVLGRSVSAGRLTPRTTPRTYSLTRLEVEPVRSSYMMEMPAFIEGVRRVSSPSVSPRVSPRRPVLPSFSSSSSSSGSRFMKK